MASSSRMGDRKPMKGTVAWWDGRWVAADRVSLPMLSPSLGRGLAVFEVLEVCPAPDRPAVFRLPDHVERLFHSARSLGLVLPHSAEELVEAVLRTVRRNRIHRGVVKILAAYAVADFGLVPRDPRATVAVFAAEMADAYGSSPNTLSSPARLGLVAVRKLDPDTMDVSAKITGHYVNAWRARREAVDRGFDEALLLDRRGCVAEAPLSNVFFLIGGRLVTPRVGPALAGITRDSVLEVLRALSLPCEETDILPDQARSAEEAFLTGTTIGVRPVLSVDGQRLGTACPGRVTTRVAEAFEAARKGRDPRFHRWLMWVK